MEENSVKKRGIAKGTSLKRSNSYPSITLVKSLEIADVVYKNAGNTFLPVEQIAKLLKKHPGYISQWLGSCVQYGLLELKSKVGYRPAEICKRIFKPFSEDEKKQALIECFKKPKLYQELISKYENSSLPSKNVLPNILDRDHSVYDDAAQKASDIFYENIAELEILNNENELVLSGNNKTQNDNPDNSQVVLLNDKNDNNQITELVPIYRKIESEDILKSEIPLTDDKKATLFYPKNINNNDIQILKAQVELILLYIKLNSAKNE